MAIDVYAGAGEAEGNTYLHIAEYAPPSSVDPARARRRFDDVLALAPVALGIRPDHVFAKTRRRDKGGSQYRDAGRRSYVTQVDEDGYLMWDRCYGLCNTQCWQWELACAHSTCVNQIMRRAGVDWPGAGVPDIDMPTITINLAIN